MTKRFRGAVFGAEASCAILALVAVACGGENNGSGSASCPAVTACGGDLVGVWNIQSMCARIPLTALDADGGAGTGLPAACNDALQGALDQDAVTPTGATIEFTSDGQYTESGTIAISFPVDYSAECLAALGGPPASSSTCDQIAASFGASQPGASGTCTLASGGCRCSASMPSAFDATGPYQTEGTTLTFDGTPPGGPYCVQGNTATITADEDGTTGSLSLTRASTN